MKSSRLQAPGSKTAPANKSPFSTPSRQSSRTGVWNPAILWILVLGAWSFHATGADLINVPELGLRIPRGFTITQVADNDLVPAPAKTA